MTQEEINKERRQERKELTELRKSVTVLCQSYSEFIQIFTLIFNKCEPLIVKAVEDLQKTHL